jgi:hypothetical protein
MEDEIETAALRGRLDGGGRLRVTTESIRQFCGSSVQLRHGALASAGSYSDRVGQDLSSFPDSLLDAFVPNHADPGYRRTLDRPRINRTRPHRRAGLAPNAGGRVAYFNQASNRHVPRLGAHLTF